MKVTPKALWAGALALLLLFLVFQAVFYFKPPGVEGSYCINNLRQIEAAKNEWALEKGKTNGEVATIVDLTPYIQLGPDSNFPECPQGGTYSLGRVGENPICSYHGDLIKSNSLVQ